MAFPLAAWDLIQAKRIAQQAKQLCPKQMITCKPSKFTSEISWDFEREWGFHMAHCLTTFWAWVCPSQGSLSWCLMPLLWLASTTPTVQVCVWQNLQCGTLSCPYGGFPTIRHNKVRDITAHLLSDVCQGVGIEPLLQSITTEQISHRTANIEDGARLDIKAHGFWENNRQCAYFDVWVFIPLWHTLITVSHYLPATEDMNRSLWSKD